MLPHDCINLVTDCGADPYGVRNSDAALKAAAVLARSRANPQPAFGTLKNAAPIFIPPGSYLVSDADFTRLHSPVIWAYPGTVTLYACEQTGSSKAVLDFTGSVGVDVTGVSIAGQTTGGGDPSTFPMCGILIGETTAINDCTEARFTKVCTFGKFTSAGIGVAGMTNSTFNDCSIGQAKADARALILSDRGDYGLASIYAPLSTGGGSQSDTMFYSCRFHGAQSATAPETIYARNASAVNTFGGIFDSSGASHWKLDGTCRTWSLIGPRFYSESGIACKYAWDIAGTCEAIETMTPNYLYDNAYSLGWATGAGTINGTSVASLTQGQIMAQMIAAKRTGAWGT